MKKINLAIVGYGGMGAYHSTAFLKNNEKFEISAIYDIDKTRYEIAKNNQLNCKFCNTKEEISNNKNIDAVLIATPNDTHLGLVKYFAKSGKHIICEKPVALTLVEYKEMVETCKNCGVVFTVHQNRRWDSDFLTIKNICESGEIGEITRIESRVQGGNGIPGDWRKFKENGGGMMLDWGVHLIDQAVCTFGVPESIYCSFSYNQGFEVDDGFNLIMNYKNRLIYEIVVDTNCFIPLPRWMVYGKSGTAKIDDWNLNGKIIKPVYSKDLKIAGITAGNGFTKTMAYRTAESVQELPLKIVYSENNAFYNEFYSMVINGKEPYIKECEVASVMKLMELAKLSAQQNKLIYLENVYD